MATFTNENKSTTTWGDETSIGICVEALFLIDDTYFFLIDNTYKLVIDKYGTCWENEQES